MTLASPTSPSVALVHDYLLVMRGAERTFRAMAECWPGAPVVTLLHDPEVTQAHFAGHPITVSPLQRLGIRQERFRALLPVLPGVAQRLEVPPADVVVSSSSAFAHGVKIPAGARHVCYCYTPFRYAWHERARALAEMPAPLRPLGSRILDRIRDWDLEASRRVDEYIAISRLSQQRIRESYGREAELIHPPVDVERFTSEEPEGYFLMVGEVTRHKNPEVACEAAVRAGHQLLVVGDGPARADLQRRYGSHVRFLGRVDDEELARLYSRADAVVVTAIEEFGIVAVEAHASGRPVIAARAGGSIEIVEEGRTGVLVEPNDVEAFAQAMHDLRWEDFDEQAVRDRAQLFSREVFQERLRAVVEGRPVAAAR